MTSLAPHHNRWEGVRDADDIMWPAALGRMKSCRLSFTVALVDTLLRERWEIELVNAEIDDRDGGTWEYRICPPGGPELRFSAWFDPAPEQQRRAAPAGSMFDIVGALVEGPLEPDQRVEMHRQLRRAPTQGRATRSTLAWVRANRSERLFSDVVESLAAGRQPDAARLCEIGYLVRTLYYQANGMEGTRLFSEYGDGHPLGVPYAAQCLCSYLTREVGFDLVARLARQRSPSAVDLDREVRRYLGLGNSTGVGLILFLDRHPRLIHRWLLLRERLVADAQAEVVRLGSERVAALLRRLDRCAQFRREDRTEYHGLFDTGPRLAADLELVAAGIRERRAADPDARWSLGALVTEVADPIGAEANECLRALIVDNRDDLIARGLAESVDPAITTTAPELREVTPDLTVQQLLGIIDTDFRWALEMDVSHADADHWAWYKAGAGEYPGLIELGTEDEPFLDWVGDTPRRIQDLHRHLHGAPAETPVIDLVARNPDLAPAVSRVSSGADASYGHIRMNLRDRNLRPMEATRFVLEAIKGFEKMEPVDQWGGRAIALQGAPLPDEFDAWEPGTWVHPPLPQGARRDVA